MHKSIVTALVGTLACWGLMLADAQTDSASSPSQPNGLCQEYLTRFGSDLDSLLANENAEEQLQIRYQSSIRLNLVAAACAAVPDANEYAVHTMPAMDALKAELGTETLGKCQAIGADLLNQLKDSAPLVISSPDRLMISTAALREMNALLIEKCPADLQSALAQLSADIDRFEDGATRWPACQNSRTALSSAIDTLSQQLYDPRNEPFVVQDEAYRPALDAFRRDCDFDDNWMMDKEPSISRMETRITDRTPQRRNACLAAIPEIETHLDAMWERSTRFTPGCDSFIAFEAANEPDKLPIEVGLNNTCELFPAGTKELRERYQRQMRLIDEFKAEDSVYRYRIESGETDAVTCGP